MQAVADKLQVLLADEHILYTKTRNYHWNVVGDNFHEMHLFFEGQYGELAEIIDEIAERIRMIGHYDIRYRKIMPICAVRSRKYC